jgi:hypothetical protein
MLHDGAAIEFGECRAKLLGSERTELEGIADRAPVRIRQRPEYCVEIIFA